MTAMPEEMIREAMGRCRHFVGTAESDTCRAGVRYVDVVIQRAPGVAGRASMPCFVKYNEAGATCEKCSFLTREEAEETVKGWNASFERAMLARTAIEEAIRHGSAYAGTIACPACGQAMSYSKARSNGHVHARCATPKCVAFME